MSRLRYATRKVPVQLPDPPQTFVEALIRDEPYNDVPDPIVHRSKDYYDSPLKNKNKK